MDGLLQVHEKNKNCCKVSVDLRSHFINSKMYTEMVKLKFKNSQLGKQIQDEM
jgi:hypothetical protein